MRSTVIALRHNNTFLLLAFALQFGGAALPHVAQAQVLPSQSEGMVALQRQDQRLAEIAGPLLERNAALCTLTMPQTGMVLHSRDQYGPELSRQLFTAGPLAAASVVAGSAAYAAGIRAGDTIAAIGQTRTTSLTPIAKQPLRDAAFEEMSEHTGDTPLTVTILRHGEESALTLAAPTACRALVEITAKDGIYALSDGRVIHISYGLAAQASDEDLAVIFAHELGHLVLEHRRRLASEGVSKGLLGEFGKSQRLNRQAEIEADQISVHLLHNAGYSPRIAPQFWRSPLGRKVSGGILRMSRTYPGASARAALMDKEIAEHLSPAPPFSQAAHLLAER